MIKNNTWYNILRIISYIVFPVAVVRFIAERTEYKKIINIFHKTVNDNDKFFKFLQQLEFGKDFFGRLWTVQMVHDKNIDANMALDVMSQTLAPFREVFEQTGLVDVIWLNVEQKDERMFLCVLEPYNHKKYVHKFIDMLASALIFITTMIFLSKYIL